jgi:rRNA-processing protein FCF1
LYVKNNGGIIATIDAELKNRIKNNGGSVLSVSNDKIVLEPSKL